MIGFERKTRRLSNCVCTLVGFIVNVLCWINLSSAASSGEQCLVLNISGAAQSVINGHYHLDRSFELHCSSHSVWTKSESSTSRLNNSSFYIYYQEDGFDGWVISNTSCYIWGDFLAGISADLLTPYSHGHRDNGNAVWKESVNGAGWTSNPRLTVECYRFASRESKDESSSGSSGSRIALILAACVVCVIAVVILVIVAFVLARQCRTTKKQSSMVVATVSDSSYRYEQVRSHHDDM